MSILFAPYMVLHCLHRWLSGGLSFQQRCTRMIHLQRLSSISDFAHVIAADLLEYASGISIQGQGYRYLVTRTWVRPFASLRRKRSHTLATYSWTIERHIFAASTWLVAVYGVQNSSVRHRAFATVSCRTVSRPNRSARFPYSGNHSSHNPECLETAIHA